ncbi:DUF982 domain-containing protein [Paracoccus sp. (in: a-proteobacteria)]|uniref:DUF982 domain-containing protein n=1 Tax=Paracoccus sp. TaxID=267 RepID=UPI0026E05D2A|nr:DUF982 domain-containing protein [Paracoccus sp. (in: a-proteobacteria)]MDO5369867.1 DUF982 domain-containing protein [Paracoccus sp. (in: a-proteobacteria)]
MRRAGTRLFTKELTLIEINWGKPLSFVMSPNGDIQEITTAEQARYWLRKKWPVSDHARDRALHQVEAAMECLASVGTARRAFISAAKSAGFVPATHMGQAARAVAA